MSSIKIDYAASSALTIALASLASDSNLLAGRQSTAWNNTSNKYLDLLIGGKISTGTSPTAGKQIEVWAYAAVNDTPTYPDAITGSDGNVTITSADIKIAALAKLEDIYTDATSSRAYWFKPRSIASLFGGELPPYGGIFVVHNTGVALHATGGNHVLSMTPVFRSVS